MIWGFIFFSREIEKFQAHHYRPPWIYGHLHQATNLTVVCFIIVAIAIVMYLRFLRVVPEVRSGLQRVPTMSYFMTEEGQTTDGLRIQKASDLYDDYGFSRQFLQEV